MNIRFSSLCCIAVFFLVASQVKAQVFFRDAPEAQLITAKKRNIVPEKYRTLLADTAALRQFLRQLPSESSIADKNRAPVIELPMPDGSTARFHVWESSIMEPALAEAFPDIRTFTGQGIDDKTATVKMDWTEFGFHATILSPVTGDVMIDPYAHLSLTNYISYFKKDYKKKGTYDELLLPDNAEINQKANDINSIQAGVCSGTQLRTYRLAVACTGEYAVAVVSPSTPTTALVLSAITTTVNRVNGVYEKEVAVRLVLVGTENRIIFLNPNSDPFLQNNNGSGLLVESQRVIDSAILNANYDIGHTFSTGAGGIARLGSVCNSSFKAYGVTGLPVPRGDSYDIDYVAHEMGHQFSANHTFNSISDFCGAGGQWSSTTNAEPGSGSTIMGYATSPSICGSDNLQNYSDDQFHAISFDQITNFTVTGTGSACAVVSATTNVAPVVNAGSNYTIPKSTYFMLTGSATDANNDVLTYCWEQVDVGAAGGAWNAPAGNAPLFRTFRDTITGNTRYFPKLSNQISGATTIGELLPSYARTMKFRLTARDNKAAGGGVCYNENLITVASSGPFTVTYPTSAVIWYVNEFRTVTWDVNGTNGAPVNCSTVNIQLSTDGGNTFPITLAANTPNDGSEEIQVPNNAGAQCRIRVMAVGNIFYDISNSNFVISANGAATFVFNTPDPVVACSGNTASATIKTGAIGGFSTSIALSASLNPAGTTVSFGSNSINPGTSTTVTLNNISSLSAGTYTVRVTGVAGSVTKTKDIVFIVGTGPAPALNTPRNDSTGVGSLPSFNWTAITGVSSYTLEISTASDFSTIAQTINGITASSYTLTNPLTENSIYYWRVKSTNACGSGNPGTAYRFKTGISSCKTSADVPKPISASGTPSVTSVLTIPANSGVTITDLNVINVTGLHSYVADLTFSLKGPNNVTVVLLDQKCAGGYQDFGLSFDDQATIAHADISCPLTGGSVVQPQSLLSAFNGINSAGTWTLIVKDNTAQDGGALTGWGLNINGTTATGCSITPTAMGVTYTFTGTGNWNVASNWSNNTIPPSPLPSGATIVINHTAGGVCTLNTTQTISAGATLNVLTGKNLVIPGTLTVQ